MRIWVAFALVLVALQSPAPAATYTWTGGGGANTNWSNASNWGGAGPGDNETGVALVFPALAAAYASNNDLTGLQVASLDVTTQLSAGDYMFTGNAITLNGAVTMASPGTGDPNLVWQIPLVLGGDVTISASGRQTQLQGAVASDRCQHRARQGTGRRLPALRRRWRRPGHDPGADPGGRQRLDRLPDGRRGRSAVATRAR